MGFLAVTGDKAMGTLQPLFQCQDLWGSLQYRLTFCAHSHVGRSQAKAELPVLYVHLGLLFSKIYMNE